MAYTTTPTIVTGDIATAAWGNTYIRNNLRFLKGEDGLVTIDAGQVIQKGADIASAAALTLGTDGNYFDVTGTTTITSISTRAAGALITLQFDGALTLTHNATTLILRRAANIATVAGDIFQFVSEGSGNWREVNPISGKTRTIILTASGGAPTNTAGCATVAKVESTTNKVNYWVLDFDTTTEENAFWVVQMPDSYDGGTITAIFVWTNAAGLTTETVVWGIKARAYADDAAIDQAWGTEVTVTDTWLAQNDVHISPVSAAVTIAGSPAGGQPVMFNVARKTASDNLTGDARLIMIKLEYTVNAYSD